MSLKIAMFNSGTCPYNNSLLLGKLHDKIGMLKIIQNKMKNEFIPHCTGKFQWPILFNCFISDLLVAKKLPLANTQLTVN